MTRTVSILLLSIFLFQAFSGAFIVAGYELNKEYIARAYCENKNRPEMHCNGKCHLKKQLDKEEKRESAPASSKEKEIQLFSEKTENNSSNNLCTGNIIFAPFRSSVTDPPFFSFFHPPAV